MDIIFLADAEIVFIFLMLLVWSLPTLAIIYFAFRIL